MKAWFLYIICDDIEERKKSKCRDDILIMEGAPGEVSEAFLKEVVWHMQEDIKKGRTALEKTIYLKKLIEEFYIPDKSAWYDRCVYEEDESNKPISFTEVLDNIHVDSSWLQRYHKMKADINHFNTFEVSQWHELYKKGWHPGKRFEPFTREYRRKQEDQWRKEKVDDHYAIRPENEYMMT